MQSERVHAICSTCDPYHALKFHCAFYMHVQSRGGGAPREGRRAGKTLGRPRLQVLSQNGSGLKPTGNNPIEPPQSL